MRIHEFEALRRGDDWSDAFHAALEALRVSDGGELRVTSGEYRTAPIRLYDGVTLRVDTGAVIRFLDDPERFPLVTSEFEGLEAAVYMPLVFADGARNIRVTGGGTLDGCGQAWWARHRGGTLEHPRPYLICFQHCSHCRIDGVTLINSPVWTIHPYDCDGVWVENVSILNPPDSPNTDGVNPNQCRSVRIHGCMIDVGDDCVAIKAGTEDTPAPRQCRDIIITGCHMRAGHGGVVIGSEMSGGVRNVLVADCVFTGTDRGIRVKTRRGRGGGVQGLIVHHVIMDGVMCPLVVNMMYFCGKGGKEPIVHDPTMRSVNAGTPVIEGITMTDVHARGVTGCAAYLHGLPESPITGVTVRDCTFTMVPGEPVAPAMCQDAPKLAAAGLHMTNARGVRLQNLSLRGARGEAVKARETEYTESAIWMEDTPL